MSINPFGSMFSRAFKFPSEPLSLVPSHSGLILDSHLHSDVINCLIWNSHILKVFAENAAHRIAVTKCVVDQTVIVVAFTTTTAAIAAAAVVVIIIYSTIAPLFIIFISNIFPVRFTAEIFIAFIFRCVWPFFESVCRFHVIFVILTRIHQLKFAVQTVAKLEDKCTGKWINEATSLI